MRKGLICMGILTGFIISMMMVSGAFAKDEIIFTVPNGNVKFAHKKHVETLKIDCLKCHHTWKKDEATGKLCHECHKGKAEGKTIAAKDAFHNDCKGCHDDAKKNKKLAGPTVCTQCHVKVAAK